MKTLKRWVKQIIWNFKWVQFEVREAIKREEISYATRLFKNAVDDVQAGFEGDVKVEAEKVAEQKLIDLLSPVDWRHVVTVDSKNGLVFIGGERADAARLKNLKSEADFLLQTELWKLMYETPKALAEKAMFVEGENLDTMRKGRSMLFTLKSEKNIVDTFAGYKG